MCDMTQTRSDPRKLVPTPPIALAQIILKMIRKRPQDRYEKWADVREAIKFANATPTGRDVSRLLDRALARQIAKEAEVSFGQRLREEIHQTNSLLKHSFDQIVREAQEIVDTFNASAQDTRLRLQIRNVDLLEISPVFSFQVSVNTGDGTMTAEAYKKEGLILPNDSRPVLAMATIRNSSVGCNPLLIGSNAEDLYGE